jgi:hypothetical protein
VGFGSGLGQHDALDLADHEQIADHRDQRVGGSIKGFAEMLGTNQS